MSDKAAVQDAKPVVKKNAGRKRQELPSSFYVVIPKGDDDASKFVAEETHSTIGEAVCAGFGKDADIFHVQKLKIQVEHNENGFVATGVPIS